MLGSSFLSIHGGSDCYITQAMNQKKTPHDPKSSSLEPQILGPSWTIESIPLLTRMAAWSIGNAKVTDHVRYAAMSRQGYGPWWMCSLVSLWIIWTPSGPSDSLTLQFLIVSIDWEYKKSLVDLSISPSFRHDSPRVAAKKRQPLGSSCWPRWTPEGADGAPSPPHVAGPVGPCSKGVATTGRAGEPGQGWGKGAGKGRTGCYKEPTWRDKE